jgi:uncharacterized membrane protein
MSAALLSGVQIAILSAVILTRSAPRYRWWIAGAAMLALLAVFMHLSQQSLVAATGIPHAIAYTALLVVFGSSLFFRPESIITAVVGRLQRPLPENIVVYTRRVTWAWCIFFAAQLLVSLLLFLFAPASTWSFFVNVLNMPLVVLMFACEYGYRLARVHNRPRSSIASVIAAFMQQKAAQSKPAGSGYPNA